MKYYYLINGKIMAANEKMPEINEQWHNYNSNLLKWSESLQPCEISESELDNVKNYLCHNTKFEDFNPHEQIEVTNIVRLEEIKTITKSGTITDYQLFFKQPKQVEEIEAVDMLLNTFGQYCTLNGIKLTDSNKVGQAVIDFLKSDIYEIFKNQK